MVDTPLYRLKDIKFRYGDRFCLDIPNLIVDRGSSLGLLGSNGAGKTTLLKLLALIENPDEGEIYLDGIRVSQSEGAAKRNVTILLQDPYLLKRSVFENVAYGLRVRGEKRYLSERVFEALTWVGLTPQDFSSRNWHELSGGEAQRVALAARLVLRPYVLILDEPTANVDQQSASLIKEAITVCRTAYHTSLIVASHDLPWLSSVTDTIKRVYDGRVLGFGARNLLAGPWHLDEDGLWKKALPDAQKICVMDAPDANAPALLDPSDIMISVDHPSRISAQNILRGIITQMTVENGFHQVLVEVTISDILLTCRISTKAAQSLHLIPGKKVYVVFKASSAQWY
jgi:tungstate transport system ATP-binding protein